ncbi:MAG: hypothetical protein KZQ70_15050 [gamma proteobacterium symbiont of Lucinoma myriamae]|nr:hypothetical protein [gamma proteobacterium symbiont of Lucinoma myriamae]
MAGVVHQAGDAYLSRAPGLSFNYLEVHVFSKNYTDFVRLVRSNDYSYMDAGSFAVAFRVGLLVPEVAFRFNVSTGLIISIFAT